MSIAYHAGNDRTDAAGPVFGSALYWAALAGVLAIRLAGLWTSRAELFFDEAQYWVWAQAPTFGYFTKPPLIAWLIAASTSICGDAPFCVRLPAPILHTLTAIVIGLLASRLFDRRIGFLASLLFALMPGTSVSSILMSTDAPLLLAWSVALLALHRFAEKRDWTSAVLLGLAIGGGLNAKYAMVYFPACTAIWLFFEPRRRELLGEKALWLALALGVALILPNIAWNAANGFATFSHTAENAGWSLRLPNFLGALEFIAIQAVIISPAPFVAYLMAGRNAPSGGGEWRGFLYAHSAPVFAAIVVQALINKANGNWAATAFPAAVALAAVVMGDERWRRARAATFILGSFVLVAVSFSGLLVGRQTLPPIERELGKLDGWADLARDIEKVARAESIDVIAVEGRGMTASLIYELRASPLQVKALTADAAAPSDHFELTRPWRPSSGGPALIVSVSSAAQLPVAADSLIPVADIATRVFVARMTGAVVHVHRFQ